MNIHLGVPAVFILLALYGTASTASETAAAPERTDAPAVRENPEKPARQKLPPRRAVPAIPDRPIAVSPPPRTSAPVVSVPQTAPSPGPTPMTSCDGGGCWGAGTRYEGGAGGAYLDKGGRLCQGNGTWMQCY